MFAKILQPVQGMQVSRMKSSDRSIGGLGGSFEPPFPPPFFEYPMKMKKNWSQWDQIISFSWDI